MASTLFSQRWLSEVEAVGTLINRKSLTGESPPCLFQYPTSQQYRKL